MSFQTAVAQAKIIAARNKVDRLLAYLPDVESEALREILNNRGFSNNQIVGFIREEAGMPQNADYSELFDLSVSAIKRWRDNNPAIVDGL